MILKTEFTIRPIEKKDNLSLAALIKSVLREFKLDRPGTVFTDPTTDQLFELFETPRSGYWVVEENGKLLGGCGIYPTEGLPEACAELVKLYLSPESRGKGLGKELMQKCIVTAKYLGYRQLYLESFPELQKAVGLYEKFGFEPLSGPMGNSGHSACTLWMSKKL